MPELAEVEYNRRQWNVGLGETVLHAQVHPLARIFRDAHAEQLTKALEGKRLVSSECSGKQMLFHFAPDIWLNLHLGMTGKLLVAPTDYEPKRDDHLLLRLEKHSLVFHDTRKFGRVRWEQGAEVPEWWKNLPISPIDPGFTLDHVQDIIQANERKRIKVLLLEQDFFPGIGNWMGDEILWQARLSPRSKGLTLSGPQIERLYKAILHVCQVALATIGVDWSDPPKDWLFHYRWKNGGMCPRCGNALAREKVNTRTTCFCPVCQDVLKG